MYMYSCWCWYLNDQICTTLMGVVLMNFTQSSACIEELREIWCDFKVEY